MTPLHRLLHHGGTAGSWGNLGLWPAADYAGACDALARRVGLAGGLAAGGRVLSVACGAGDELRLWAQAFGAGQVIGVEADASLAALAAASTGFQVHAVPGTRLLTLGLDERSFDCVLCVDAAYHLQPRQAFVQAAWRLLRPGGRLAYCDLLIDGPRAVWKTLLLHAGARVCGLAAAGLLTAAQQHQLLADAGFADVRIERLDEAVLGGFARFVPQQARLLGPATRQAAWRRAAVTARLIPPCRAAGLGYGLFSALRPGLGEIASATA